MENTLAKQQKEEDFSELSMIVSLKIVVVEDKSNQGSVKPFNVFLLSPKEKSLPSRIFLHPAANKGKAKQRISSHR